MENKKKISISVVVPVYNSEDCLEELVRRLTNALKKIEKEYEIILVNDCSQDKSWQKIVQLSRTCNKLKGIDLRKNFGQDNAIMAGLNYCLGKSVIIMDDDLQHSPEDITFLLKKIKEGYDVCYAKFASKKQSWFKNFGSWFNDKVANIVLKKPKDIYLSSYKAIKREVVKEITKYKGPFPYVDGLLFQTTQNITQINTRHHTRLAGRGNYSLPKSIAVWLRLATNFSVVPLRVATFLGFIVAGIGFVMILVFIIQHFLGITGPTGWASLAVMILFLGGVQLITIGVAGEYIGQSFLHQNKKPQFTIKEIIKHKENEKNCLQKNG